MKLKSKIGRFPGDNILLNLGAIVVVSILLLLLTLWFLNLYTRHGQNIEVPHLQGLQAEEAEAILKSKGLNILIVDSIFQKEAVPGSIVDQKPKPNNRVKEGRDIYVTIYARNPQQISVPGLVDFSVRQAMALLNSIGFTQITITEVPAQYHGLVISVEYRGRELAPDEQIPAGAPLKLIVGRSMMKDSLNRNQEQEAVLESIKRGSDSVRRNNPARQSNMDNSFF